MTLSFLFFSSGPALRPSENGPKINMSSRQHHKDATQRMHFGKKGMNAPCNTSGVALAPVDLPALEQRGCPSQDTPQGLITEEEGQELRKGSSCTHCPNLQNQHRAQTLRAGGKAATWGRVECSRCASKPRNTFKHCWEMLISVPSPSLTRAEGWMAQNSQCKGCRAQ